MEIDYEYINQLKMKIEQLINQHPHLRMLQTEIDIVLNEAGDDPVERCKAMSNLMRDIIQHDLLPAVRDLNGALKKLSV